MLDKNLTTKQLENIVFDGAVAYANYGELDSRMIAPLKEGAKIEITQTRYEITRDGAISPEKGMVKIVEERIKATLGIIGMLLEDLRLCLAGTTIEKNGSDITAIEAGNGDISLDEYLKNLTIIGETLDGTWKKITIYNPLGGEGLNIDTQTKEEAVLEVVVQGHKNPEDRGEPLYRIENATAEEVYNITFQTGQANTLVYLNGKTKMTNSDGNVTFYNYGAGSYPYIVTKIGYAAQSANASVVDSNLTVSLTMSSIT
jgi:hypothetical protein